ncbi:hypothetical protein, partial [Sinorhizobium sp. BJ1]|uniref:hypothetical protein n=1 Tax=Sinorhizobium sp. BJ1 TaxID=2035455 RepID=UPI001FE1B2FE
MRRFIGALTMKGATMPCDLRPAMKVCVFHEPNGEWARCPFADQALRLVSFVLVEVSSIKISRANAEGPAPLDPQITRPRDLRTPLFACLQAFFMAEP